MTHPRLSLHAGDLTLEFAPTLGGAITALRKGEADLLRPTPAAASDVLETACFPLVPYANRIGGGRVEWLGRSARLRRNMAGETHPLHGDGWRGAWRVEHADAASATLAFAPADTDWPWPYAARQTFVLTAQGLSATLAMTNTGDAPAPAGLGFHPYFPDAGEARLTAWTEGVWLADAELLPTRHVPGQPFADWASGAAVKTGRLVDHCHTGWDGAARIGLLPSGPVLTLSASPELSFLHTYTPPGEPFFCVEPVSHRPDAINATDPLAEGLRVLAPGETFAASLRIDIET